MATEIGTIVGEDGETITISVEDGRLTASNGDDVHPHSHPYRDGPHGEAQAIADFTALWGGSEWAAVLTIDPAPYEDYPTAVGEGYARDTRDN
jgi:hypothetical protein